MILINYFLNIFNDVFVDSSHFHVAAHNTQFLQSNSIFYSRQLIYYESNFVLSDSTTNICSSPLKTGIPPLDDLCSFIYDPLDKKGFYDNLVFDSFSVSNYGKTAPIFKGENECVSLLSLIGNFLFKIFFFWSTPP